MIARQQTLPLTQTKESAPGINEVRDFIVFEDAKDERWPKTPHYRECGRCEGEYLCTPFIGPPYFMSLFCGTCDGLFASEMRQREELKRLRLKQKQSVTMDDLVEAASA